MQFKINPKKILNSLKRLPKIIVRRAFMFYLLFFTIEALFGLIIYYNYAFPDIAADESSQLGVDIQVIEKAVERLEEERKELADLENKEYFDLIKIPEQDIPEEEVNYEEVIQEEDVQEEIDEERVGPEEDVQQENTVD